METPDHDVTSTRLGTAARACCEAIETARDWTRPRVHWPDAGQAWVELVHAIDAFCERARVGNEAPERMVIQLKAILEAALPSAETISTIRDVVISYAIESYFRPDG
jgi:hypothetical protein